jgi:hypothetical protein
MMVSFLGDRMKLTTLCIAAAVAATAVLVPVPALAGETTEARANQLPLRYKDANGKVVGRAAWGGREGAPFIIMQEGKQIFPIAADARDPSQIRFSGATVYYKTADCSGQAYLYQDWESMLPGLRLATVLLSGDGHLSVLIAQGLPENFETQSQSNFYYPTCSVSIYQISNAVPVTDTIDITGKYQPPFTIH